MSLKLWASLICAATLASGAAFATGKPSSVPPRPPVVAPAAPAPQPPSWDGTWSGSFGARLDVAVTISGQRVTGVTFFGAPAPVISSTVSGNTVNITLSDFSLSMTRFTATAAQSIYENRRNEKAVTLLNKS
jgi:hypothetical protein